MPRYISPPQSFLAWIDYDLKENWIEIIFKKDGKRYRYSDLSKSTMLYFDRANNKSNYLIQNVLKKECEQLDNVPMETIKLIRERYLKHLKTAQ